MAEYGGTVMLVNTWVDQDGTMYNTYYDDATGKYYNEPAPDSSTPLSQAPLSEDHQTDQLAGPMMANDVYGQIAPPMMVGAPNNNDQPTQRAPVYNSDTGQYLGDLVSTWNPDTGGYDVQPDPGGLLADPGAPAPTDASGTGTDGGYTADGSSSGGYGSSGGYSSHGGYSSSRGYSSGSSGGYGSSGGGGYSSGSSGQDNLANARAWQNNWIAQHTQGGGGASSQKTAEVPGGASAGPWGARSAPPISAHMPGGGGSSGGGGGGGGGSTRGLIDSIRSNIMGKLGGMFGGGSSGYSSSGYRTHGQNKTPAYPQPNDRPMHGFAHVYDRLNAQTTLYAKPELVIPRAIKGGFAPTTSGLYDELSALPIGPLADLLASNRHKATTNSDSTNGYINKTAALYQRIATPGAAWPDFDHMLHVLNHPKRGSELGIAFGMGTPPLTPVDLYNQQIYGKNWVDPRKSYQPPAASTQEDTYMQYVSAINRLKYGSDIGSIFSNYDQKIADAWAAHQVRRKLGAGKKLPHVMAHRGV